MVSAIPENQRAGTQVIGRTSDLGWYLGRFPGVKSNLLEESGERVYGLMEWSEHTESQIRLCLKTGKFRDWSEGYLRQCVEICVLPTP